MAELAGGVGSLDCWGLEFGLLGYNHVSFYQGWGCWAVELLGCLLGETFGCWALGLGFWGLMLSCWGMVFLTNTYGVCAWF